MAKQARENWEITTLLGIQSGQEPNRWYAEKLITAGLLKRENYRKPGQRGRDAIRYVLTDDGLAHIEKNKDYLESGEINTKEVRDEVKNFVNDKDYTEQFNEYVANPTWSDADKLEIIYAKRTRAELVPAFVSTKYPGDRAAQTKACRALVQLIEAKKHRPDLKW